MEWFSTFPDIEIRKYERKIVIFDNLHFPHIFGTLELQGPYGPLKNSSPCGGMLASLEK